MPKILDFVVNKIYGTRTMKKCLKLTITGSVQNVGLRSYIKSEAEKIGGLEGTAQNMPDGTVTVQICGQTDNVEALIDAIYQGTKNAKIENITSEALRSPKDFRNVFRIIG